MDVDIRPVRPDELAALLALYRHLHAVDAPLPDAAAVAATWDEILDDRKLQCLVAADGALLVGSVTLVIVPNLTRGARPYGLIENVVTHADYRKRGIGTRLLHEALQRAWDVGCYKVMLLTGRKDAGTLRFYAQAGFKAGIKTGFIATPE